MERWSAAARRHYSTTPLLHDSIFLNLDRDIHARGQI